MPTTSNFGWTTPADTDLVKDGAAAIRTLGNGIDSSLIDLKGGTTGQILAKASNADLDYSWINNDQGDITAVTAGTGLTGGGTTGAVSVSLDSPVAATLGGTAQTTYTTGDLLYASATNTLAKRAIGTTGQVLTVSSGVPTWATPASTASGLTLITRSTFSSVSSHSVNSVFSSTYDNYRVLITLDQDAAGEPTQFFRLRTSTDATTNYVINRVTILGTSIFNNQPTDKWDFGNLGSAFDMASVTLDIFKPNLAEKTGMVGQSNFNNTTATANIFGGGQTDTTQFTGFTLFGSSGNITGVATVYGYQKS